jgi:hypothetical protein
MNRIFALLVAVVISASVARADDVKVKAVMTTGPQNDPVTSFASDTPKLLAMFKTKGIQSGTKVRGVLIAIDVGDVAPANTKVLEKTLTLDEDTDDGDFAFSKPTNDWPVGEYRVEIYVNDELATTVKFTIKAVKSKKESDKEKESSEE